MTGPRHGVPDLLEGGTEPPRWRNAWTAVPAAGRRAVVALVLLALVGAGALWLRDRAAEQERRERVELSTTFGVVSSSFDPPAGSVRFFLLVRNEGPLPVTVTDVDGGGADLRVRLRADGARTILPGREVEVPLSVRLTCPVVSDELTAEVRVRRADGGTVTRWIDLPSAHFVIDVATTLCGVRPELRRHELSGPVLRDR